MRIIWGLENLFQGLGLEKLLFIFQQFLGAVDNTPNAFAKIPLLLQENVLLLRP